MTREDVLHFFEKNAEILTLPIIVKKGNQVYSALFKIWEQYEQLIEKTDALKDCMPIISKHIASLKQVINAYYESDFDRANQSIRSIIEYFATPQNENHSISYLETLFADNEWKQWFRARVNKGQLFGIDDMRHIPADKRCLINNNRYSINGIPCVYLSNSILTCWEELGRPSIDELYVNRYYPKNGIKVFNLSTTGYDLINAQSMIKYVAEGAVSYDLAVIEYFLQWVLQSACSVVVEESNRIFKEEYVIPQLLMQNLRKYNIDGVIYFSTRGKLSFRSSGSWIAKNIAIPVLDIKGWGEKDEKYSPTIDKMFDLTEPINVGMYRNGLTPLTPTIHHESNNWTRSHAIIFLVSIGGRYSDSLFYKCEIELQNYSHNVLKNSTQDSQRGITDAQNGFLSAAP